MRKLTNEQFERTLKQSPHIKPRIKREVKFNVSVGDMTSLEWEQTDLLAIRNKSDDRGVLLLQIQDKLFTIGYQKNGTVRDGRSGRQKAIICDFCYTWRAGGDAGLVTFFRDSHSENTVSQLCCLDFTCSRNVRTLTKASIVSRTQLREDMTNETRIERMQKHLSAFTAKMDIPAVNYTDDCS